MRASLGQRSLEYALALLLLLSLNFFLPRLLTGDPVTLLAGDGLGNLTPELEESLKEGFELNLPLLQQFSHYALRLLEGDLGYSPFHSAPVAGVVLGALPWTLLLMGGSLLIATLLGVLLGVETAWRRGGRLEGAVVSALIALGGLPSFFIGLLLVLALSLKLGWFPSAGAYSVQGVSGGGMALVLDVLHHLVLPLSSLILFQLPRSFLLARGAMVGALGKPFILAARAKGLSERALHYRHALRFAFLPVVAHLGVKLGRLAGGALFVETVFAYPGLGLLIYEGILRRDYPLIQGALLLMAIFVLAANFFSELLYSRLDPRLADAH